MCIYNNMDRFKIVKTTSPVYESNLEIMRGALILLFCILKLPIRINKDEVKFYEKH